MPLVCTEEYAKAVSEVVNIAVDCTEGLDSGESLTGTITATASGITVDNVTVTSTTKVINGRTVAAGKAITARVSGGTAATRYEIKFSGATDSSPAQTRQIRNVIISVQAD